MKVSPEIYFDPETGSEVTKWTSSDKDDQHLYFTSPSITDDDRFIIIISEINGDPNLYSINRETNDLIQISDSKGLLFSYTYPQGGANGLSKASPFLDSRRNILYWIQDDSVWGSKIEETPVPYKLADLLPGWVTGYVHLSDDGKKLCIPCTDPAAFKKSDLTQHGQLKQVPQRMVKHGLVTKLLILDIDSRKIRVLAELPFWVTHVQFIFNYGVLCNSEGVAAITANKAFPYWGRIWLVDDKGYFKRLFDQDEGEYVNHENLLNRSGNIIYHGTDKLRFFNKLLLYSYLGLNRYFNFRISSKRIQRIYKHFVAIRNPGGKLEDITYLNIPVSHAVEGNSQFHFFVDSRDGYIYGRENEKGELIKICKHGSSMRVQDAHPHPRAHVHSSSLIFTSDIEGCCNVYEVKPKKS